MSLEVYSGKNSKFDSIYYSLLNSVSDVLKKLQEYVEDINENIEKIDTRGPVSKYVLPDEDLRGRYAFVDCFV